MNELLRLASLERGASNSNEGFVVDVIARTSESSALVLDRVREVLKVVLSNDLSQSLEAWKSLLPSWFVSVCADEITQEEAERRRNLPMSEREHLAQQWTLSAWLYWFKPEERFWKWWDAACPDNRSIIVRILVTGYPFPSGSLEWLLRAAGATDVLVNE